MTNHPGVAPAPAARVAMGERHECELTVFVLSLPLQLEWLWERDTSVS